MGQHIFANVYEQDTSVFHFGQINVATTRASSSRLEVHKKKGDSKSMIIRDFIDTQATEAGLLTQQARLMLTILVLMLIAPTARIWPNANHRM